MGIYIQYGCGLSCPEGWLNFDSSPRLRFERLPVIGNIMRTAGKALYPERIRFGDIVLGLPVADGAASGVYCSHVLEHLDRSSVVKALRNTHDLLNRGGVFRLVVPDLLWRAREFVKGAEEGYENAADEFMDSTTLGVRSRSGSLRGRIRSTFGNTRHLWMYDFAQMEAALISVGFVEVRRCALGDADDAMFALVEEKSRFVSDSHDELAIEARRS